MHHSLINLGGIAVVVFFHSLHKIKTCLVKSKSLLEGKFRAGTILVKTFTKGT